MVFIDKIGKIKSYVNKHPLINRLSRLVDVKRGYGELEVWTSAGEPLVSWDETSKQLILLVVGKKMVKT